MAVGKKWVTWAVSRAPIKIHFKAFYISEYFCLLGYAIKWNLWLCGKEWKKYLVNAWTFYCISGAFENEFLIWCLYGFCVTLHECNVALESKWSHHRLIKAVNQEVKSIWTPFAGYLFLETSLFTSTFFYFHSTQLQHSKVICKLIPFLSNLHKKSHSILRISMYLAKWNCRCVKFDPFIVEMSALWESFSWLLSSEILF